MKKTMIASLTVAATLTLAACGTTNAQVPAEQPSNINALEAQSLATGFLEGSEFRYLEVNTEANTYEITVAQGDNLFTVHLTLTGELIRISPVAELVQDITREAAIQLAEAHLAEIGITGARLEYANLTIENGRQVWDIEFEQGGRDLEFYVDVETGEFLKAPVAQSTTPAPTAPTPTTPAPATNAPAPSKQAPATNTPAPSAPAPTTPAPSTPAPAPSTPAPTPSAPATTGVTRDEAARIAMGVVPNGTLIEVDRDMERGRAVWYVAIRVGNRVHEVYVDMENGNIILHESYED